jgi:hypothetical protein
MSIEVANDRDDALRSRLKGVEELLEVGGPIEAGALVVARQTIDSAGPGTVAPVGNILQAWLAGHPPPARSQPQVMLIGVIIRRTVAMTSGRSSFV